jgi:CheY-like chemotaxis protein
MILESGGYSIREARDGREALASVRAQAPSLAIIDLSMPALDGWSLLRELRADESTRSVPCVALTAFAGEEDRQRALEAGFDAYLSKPYRAKELLELVRDMLGRHAPHAADGDGARRKPCEATSLERE